MIIEMHQVPLYCCPHLCVIDMMAVQSVMSLPAADSCMSEEKQDGDEAFVMCDCIRK